MADPYIGEIRIFPYFSFAGTAPYGWLSCNGQTLNVMQYQALYAVIGNIYGGNAQQQNFTLPNLMGYAPVGMGQGTGLLPYTLGTPAGQASVPLSQPNLPPHTHSVTAKAGNPGTALLNNVFLSNPAGADLNLPATRANSTAAYTTLSGYATVPTTGAQLASPSLAATGTGAAHENRQPFLTFLFCIAWEGVYPVNPN